MACILSSEVCYVRLSLAFTAHKRESVVCLVSIIDRVRRAVACARVFDEGSREGGRGDEE